MPKSLDTREGGPSGRLLVFVARLQLGGHLIQRQYLVLS